ncbi:aminotransferase class V-fold PLP-dependent enzyme [Ferrimonas lipolytica]|uniref:cysteine desulfurase n=1 Tax=Ferrimonas lipolytica TaxID=2724191 RepID=A0A6H1UCP0_9GAMM|nr:aminotransferase class V-fold PLP-dependent enzyme [Ferrimonas lipolytica]QIZ75572.1 aminotransferase class V-fold PLP-dependent enzyme [Ferrimonas lipolytica]
MIYLDHAATSNPKPATVVDAMMHFISDGCANPGRASHPLANAGARLIFDTRQKLLQFFHAEPTAHAVFTANITESLNLALKGLLQSGDEVIVSSMEHNAMMRPLRQLEQNGVVVTVIECDPQTGIIDVDAINAAISATTRLVAINHGSNTFGTVQPIAEIGALCRQQNCLFLIDSAQTAGCTPINMSSSNVDLLAFTGHKGLLGPMGIGGLVLNARAQDANITPLICGGTGSNSELEIQPQTLPDALESGTPNLPGIAGLNAALDWLEHTGVDTINQHEQCLTAQLIAGLKQIPGVSVLGPAADQPRVGVVSLLIDGKDNGEIDEQLAYDHQIYCRTGLHCAPASHQTMGTFPNGTVRLSVGAFTRADEVQCAIEAIAKIASN